MNGCPHPHKIRYLDKHAAKLARRRYPKLNGTSPYRCRCGFWHLGHLKPGGTRAVARRIMNLKEAA